MKALLFLFALFPQTGAYSLLPAQTDVEITVDSTLHTVHGKFNLKSGEIRLDPASGAVSGQLVVDANSGASGSEARDHRMTREILESVKYPDIVFQPDRMEGKLESQGRSQVKLHGVFAIHGKQHEITALVDVQASGGTYDATARFDVPYIEWGMKNPSTLILRVNKVATVTVHTVLHPMD
jgi:polyisoprenoid-binding protein YceI